MDSKFIRNFSGVYIDDAGTPGAVSPSAFLHPYRKSWAAVIVPDSATPSVAKALRIFLGGIGGDYGARELHFSDIYGGRLEFRNVPIEERYELIDLMVQIFEKFQLPIVFQTCSPEFLSEIRPKIGVLPKIDFLDLDKPDHFALFVLLLQVRRFMADHRQYFGRALPVIIDEGLVKSGVVVELPHWADSFRKGRVEFRKSHECAFLQLADFAAFAISRTQWLLAKGNLKRHDVRFLEIVSNERLCVINLPSAPISLDNHTAANYDRYMKRDRRAKGLPDDPPSG